MPPTTLRIYDLRDGTLAVHLPDLIDLLSPHSFEASWIVSPVSVKYPTLGPSLDEFMIAGPGRPAEDQLEILAISGASVSGEIFSKYAQETYQAIFGQFVATLPEQMDAWVVISAIDSTFYEVSTSDEMVLVKIMSAYKDVRVAPGPVASAPIPPVPREGGDQYVAPNGEPVEMTGTFGDTQIKNSSEIDVGRYSQQTSNWVAMSRLVLRNRVEPRAGQPMLASPPKRKFPEHDGGREAPGRPIGCRTLQTS